jgi:hypothetical protein
VDEAFLDVSSESQIQIQVRHRGLDVFVSQAVFDVDCRVSPGEHMNGAGVPKAVHGIDDLEAFRRQGHREIFSTKPIDAEAGEFLTALINKEALLKGRLWGRTESRDIESKELSGSGLQFDEAEAVAFAQDSEGILLGVEVVHVKSGHFRGPGA